MTTPRRFPPPWSVEELTESFVIRDASGQALAYVYFEDKDSRRKVMKRLTRGAADRGLAASECGSDSVLLLQCTTLCFSNFHHAALAIPAPPRRLPWLVCLLLLQTCWR